MKISKKKRPIGLGQFLREKVAARDIIIKGLGPFIAAAGEGGGYFVSHMRATFWSTQMLYYPVSKMDDRKHLSSQRILKAISKSITDFDSGLNLYHSESWSCQPNTNVASTLQKDRFFYETTKRSHRFQQISECVAMLNEIVIKICETLEILMMCSGEESSSAKPF